MKEILINTSKNEVRGNCTITVYGRNDATGQFVMRTPLDYYEASAIRDRIEFKQEGVLPADVPEKVTVRKLNTHTGRSEMLGGDGVSAFGSWVIADTSEEWWETRCGNETIPTERHAERVGGIVRAIRRQMEGSR